MQMMRTLCCTLFYCLFFLFSFSQKIKKIDGSSITAKALDKKIRYLMDTAHVAGLCISIFNNNEVVYQRSFGFKNAATKEPFTPVTNIYGASLSKSLFAVLIMKLVEEGVIDLDTPLQNYLDKPIYEYTPKAKWHDDFRSLKNDTLYRQITARMCLDHTTGFPNWRWDEPDQKPRIRYKPGSHYSYSGEGMVFLQVVLEKKLGKTLNELMKEKVFVPLGMQHSAYTFLPAFEADYSVGHNASGKPYEKDKDNEPRSPSTLETTLNDYTIFEKAVLQHTLLNAATTQQLFTPQIRLRSVVQMGPYPIPESNANDGIDLSYGLGWGLLKTPYGWGAFKEGHGDGFRHYTILFPSAGKGILIMTNSDNGGSIFKELLETAIGDTYTPWQWQRYIPYHVKQ